MYFLLPFRCTISGSPIAAGHVQHEFASAGVRNLFARVIRLIHVSLAYPYVHSCYVC